MGIIQQNRTTIEAFIEVFYKQKNGTIYLLMHPIRATVA
jgi:hypothetical protein